MKKIAKFVNKLNLKEEVLAALMIIAVIIAVIPLLRLALYATPFYDDYGYSLYVKRYLDMGEGLKGIIAGVSYSVKSSWYAWQGTYGSILFMSLMPAAFGEQYYCVGLWIIILTITVSVFDFSYTLAVRVCKSAKASGIIAASIISLFVVELINTAHQGFYWYNGAVHYTFMYGLMLLMLSNGIKIVCSEKTIECILRGVVLVILSFLVAGANFVVALQGIMIMAVLLVFSLVLRKKNSWILLPAIIIYAFGLWLNVSAPGNSRRGAYYNGFSPAKSILLSFKEAFTHIPQFTGLITIVFIVLLIPILWNIVHKMNYEFKLPGLVSLLSYCFYATGFTPSLYGMGSPGLERTFNAVKFTMQLLLVINEAYWLGWLANRLKRSGKNVIKLNHNIIFYFAILVSCVWTFAVSNNQAGSYSSYGAYYYVHTGEAYNYRAEYLATIEAINDSMHGEVVVNAHVFRPWLLCGNNELDSDPNAEQNRFMADFYRVKSIRIAE